MRSHLPDFIPSGDFYTLWAKWLIVCFGFPLIVVAEEPFEDVLKRQREKTSPIWSWQIPSKPPISMEVKPSLTFWRQIQPPLLQQHWLIVPAKEGRELKLVNTSGNKIFEAIADDFLIRLQSIRTEEKFGVHATRKTEMEFQVWAHPWMELYRVGYSQFQFKQADGTTRVLPIQQSWVNGTGAIASLQLQLPDGPKQSLDDFQLQLKVTAADQMRRFEFLANKPETKTLENVQVRLVSTKRLGNKMAIDFELVYPNDFPTFESFEEDWLYRNTLEIELKDGSRYQTNDMQIAPKSVRYFVPIEKWGDQKAEILLHLNVPVGLKDRSLKAHFAAIPLP